jgi:hypothetical protein
MDEARREGFVDDVLGVPPGREEDKGAANVVLRRFPNVASSRGGVLIGDLRTREERCAVSPLASSSKVRPVLCRFGEFVLLIGTGALEEL